MKDKMTSNDVVAIIKACGDAKVRSFQMGNLKFSFDDQAPTFSYQSPMTITMPGVLDRQNPESSGAQMDLDELVATDPVRWEAIHTGEEILDERS